MIKCNMKKLELLSPAGSRRALTAAVQSGADAVYIGGAMFSARQGAANFSIEEMAEAVRYCHLYGVKVYVAVNTLVKDREINLLAQYARDLNQMCVDGVIIQDLGAAEILKKAAPEIELHASTQMTVTSLAGVRFLEEHGFSRVVLARELSAEAIAEICRQAKAEIEVFVHGALCMSYSGQCLMSSIIGGRSRNRGCCAQPCRLMYGIEEQSGKTVKRGHLLSPKDLALIEEIGQLKKMGVASLKIEGRLKRPEYVSAVTGLYRKYIDAPGKITAGDWKQLNDAFNRGRFSKAYFAGQTGGAMMSVEKPGNASDNLFSEEAKRRAAQDADVRKLSVDIYCSLEVGKPLVLTMVDEDGNAAVSQSAEPAEKAVNQPLSEERLSRQVSKLGGTPFLAQNVCSSTDGISVMKAAQINQVRRDAAEHLIKMRTERMPGASGSISERERVRRQPELYISIEANTPEQIKAARKQGISRIFAPEHLAAEYTGVIPILPDIDRDKTASQGAADCVCVMNLAQLQKNKKRPIVIGHRMNVFNAYTADFLKDCGNIKGIVLSPELNLREITELLEASSGIFEVIAYGRLPLMLMENCPVKAYGFCRKDGKGYFLRDRKGESFPILCAPDCTARLLNSKPVYMADKLADLKKTGIDGLRLVFTTEEFSECLAIINEYKNALNGIKIQAPSDNTFTRGHFYRGVQ